MGDWRSWFRDPWLLLILGVLLGIGLGLATGWLVWPVNYRDTDLYDLRADYQDDFVVMVGALEAMEQDAAAALQLLTLLSDPDAPRSVDTIVIEVTERFIARGVDLPAIDYLVGLAQELGSVTTPMQPFLNKDRP